VRFGLGDLILCLAAWAAAFAAYAVLRTLRIQPKIQVDEMAGFAIPIILGLAFAWILIAAVLHVESRHLALALRVNGPAA
jgi:hypothetical protein